MNYSQITEARAVVREMPREAADRLRSILSVRMSPAKRRSLILGSGLPLGALIVADAYQQLRPAYRRCA